ncbi:MAG: ATP-binding protein [Cyclobacteriaceae bacterium]|nr:ATP-binding protein [Cyclobacteriaceae bacterium]
MINRLVDKRVSPIAKEDNERYLRAKVLGKFILLCLTAAIFFAGIYVSIGLMFSFYTVSVSILLFGLFFYYLKYIQNTTLLVRLVVSTCLLIILSLTIDTGGRDSVIVPLFAIVPVISMLYGTRKDALFFVILISLLLAIIYLLPLAGINFSNNISNEYQHAHDLLFKVFASIFIILIFFAFESEFKTAHEEVMSLNKQFRKSEIRLQEMAEQAINFSEYLAETEEELKKSLEEEKASKKMLQEAQSKLVQSEKMASVGQLTAGIAHEINNPVNFIQTGIIGLEENLNDILAYDQVKTQLFEKIKDSLDKGELTDPNGLIDKAMNYLDNYRDHVQYDDVLAEVENLMKSIKNGANRTAEIVLGLRTFSRLDENSYKKINLSENLDATLVLLQNKYKNRVKIVKIYQGVPQVECMPGKLNQVFMNLIVNGLQAIQENGVLTIGVSFHEENEKVRVSIGDTGTGIPKEIQDKIFDPFFTTKDVGEGTGLGLAITKGIIEEHHAVLSFETEAGKGTTFYIDLPIVQPNKTEKAYA